MFEMPKETEKGKKVKMRKGGNHATTTDSSETETPPAPPELPKSIMLAEMRAAG